MFTCAPESGGGAKEQSIQASEAKTMVPVYLYRILRVPELEDMQHASHMMYHSKYFNCMDKT